MTKGDITIDEKLCKGCGLCVEFCSRGCIAMPEGKVSARGLPLAEESQPAKATPWHDQMSPHNTAQPGWESNGQLSGHDRQREPET